MPTWQLEAITAQDLDKILIIDRLAFKRPWSRTLYLDELSCDKAFSYAVKCNRADQDLTIIAYAFWRMVVTELHIVRIAVAPDFRSKGVATWLLQQCFKLAKQKKDFDSICIEVRPSNNAAIALYRKLGFYVIGTRPHYYPESGEDALVMRKQLKEGI
jgi:[ribosomal protein S18]-alanine N-acetyltransferase